MDDIYKLTLTKDFAFNDTELRLSNNNVMPEERADVFFVLSLQEEDFKVPDNLKKTEETNEGVLQELIKREDFMGKEGSSIFTRVQNCPFKYIGMIGVGDAEGLDSQKCVQIGKVMMTLSSSVKAATICLFIPNSIRMHNNLLIILENFFTAATPDNRFKFTEKKKEINLLKELHIMSSFPEKAIRNVFNKAMIMTKGRYMTKDIVSAPANYLHTTSLAKAAVDLAKEVGLSHKILEKDEIAKLGMHSYLAVGQGSIYPPKFIHLTYKSEGTISKKIALIGKGICFDSGGYNLKVNGMIELMKFDCGGAGAVLGAAKSIGLLKPMGVEVHFIIAAAENMISAEAYRPGDIITASNGKSIEVGNTDAEGRLTLADALVFATNLKVDEVIDIATLTGACMVALGSDCAGVWSSHDDMAADIVGCGEEVGEMHWHMPLIKKYKKDFESKYADLNNVGGKFGGAITAALFLKEFVDTTQYKWSHIDIAGPAWDMKEGFATGFGAKTLTAYVLSKSVMKE